WCRLPSRASEHGMQRFLKENYRKNVVFKFYPYK
ncbi:MAG: hypothetical protein ACI85O_000327, partial [Saprospiraceae bacterium]